jgi:mannose-6-phosphate isomerase-like protein (cupin superfamily)
MVVERWYDEADGPFSEVALRRKMEERGYFVSRYVYPPGTCFPDHTHELDKLDGVVSGRFRMTTAAGSVVLEAGDCLRVPRGTVHSAEVVGNEPVVSLDGIHYG